MSLLKRKTALATFGELLGKIGPLSIPASGHTVHEKKYGIIVA